MTRSQRVAQIWSASLFIAALFLTFCGNAQPHEIFPGKKSSLESPNAKYIVLNIDAKDAADSMSLGENHALFLRDVATSKEAKILAYARHVTVFWSPDSKFIAINDFEGSDSTSCYIYIVAEGKLLNIIDSARKAIRPKGKDDHFYVEAINWESGSMLKIKCSGYGENNGVGVERWFEYEVNERHMAGGASVFHAQRSGQIALKMLPTGIPVKYMSLL